VLCLLPHARLYASCRGATRCQRAYIILRAMSLDSCLVRSFLSPRQAKMAMFLRLCVIFTRRKPSSFPGHTSCHVTSKISTVRTRSNGSKHSPVAFNGTVRVPVVSRHLSKHLSRHQNGTGEQRPGRSPWPATRRTRTSRLTSMRSAAAGEQGRAGRRTRPSGEGDIRRSPA
jgi:hypothetical protein